MNVNDDTSAPAASAVTATPRQGALRIVGVYVLVSFLWILLSDRAVAWLFDDAEAMARISTLKGWGFVAVTAVLLFALIARLLERHAQALAQVSHKALALGESEALLQDAQRIAGIGSYVLDIRAGIWRGSAVCDEIFGIMADADHSVQGWVALIHPLDREGMVRYFRDDVLAARQRFDRRYRIVRPCDGAERWLHGIGEQEFAADGTPLLMRGTIRDVTEARRAQLALAAAHDRLQATLNALPDLLFETDGEGRIHQYHSRRTDLLAASPESFLGRRMAEFLPPEATAVCEAALREADHMGHAEGGQYALDLPQGRRWFELSVASLPDRDEAGRRFIMIARDITERKRAQDRLQLAARVFNDASEGITITDAQGTILDVNGAFTRITGYSREEVLGQNPRMLQSGRQGRAFYEAMWNELTHQGSWSGEIWNRRKGGEVYAELLSISAMRDEHNNTLQYVALFSDISAIKAHQAQLEHMAHFDALTGLPNRLLMADRLQQAMSQAGRRGKHLAVAFLDLDAFKHVNDAHGHEVGDQLLVALAQRMKEALREGDTLARIGGDEFVAVLIDLDDVTHCLPLLNRLLRAVADPVDVNSQRLHTSASLGVTFYPQLHSLDADQLLRQADQAMYQAKLSGKNRYHVFDAELDSSIRDHHAHLEDIRLALARGEFVLHYQPKVHLRSGQVVGVEALIRWQHPERGLVAPAEFLPVIENHPLAVSLGEWVIGQALSQMAVWLDAGLDLRVSVNVGARQLQQSDFVDRLTELLAAHPQVPPARLEMEILETSALNDMAQVSQVIEACARLGVDFALDDFGTGYSSLTYLKRLQVKQLKIDQSFVRDMLDDPEDLAILTGVIGLAKAFGREALAEGVETVAHGTALLQLGCELAQGYGIARPMAGDAIAPWVAHWQPDPAWRRVGP